jgi:hypothetical protein
MLAMACSTRKRFGQRLNFHSQLQNLLLSEADYEIAK